ncbi:MAG: aldose 1-epimerase family protein [Methylovirgula sp.]
MIRLQAGAAHACIAEEGAEIVEWVVGGKPLLWRKDPAVWNETAPLLFPVVGWTKNHQVRVGAKCYPLGLHGFARYRTFRVAEQGDDCVRLTLASDADTRALYPFEFSLSVDVRLGEATISVEIGVANCGTGPMPYACGLHPGFRWPFAGGAPENYLLRFAEPEDPLVPVIAPGGLISPERRRLPLAGRVLHLAASLFQNDALCFLNAASREIRFEAPDGSAIVVAAENFPHFGIWCHPGHGYLCIEEWTGYSDPENFSGDLFEKPSMLVLAPGASGRHRATFTYAAAPHPLAELRKPDR